jgi:hypothetical protein
MIEEGGNRQPMPLTESLGSFKLLEVIRISQNVYVAVGLGQTASALLVLAAVPSKTGGQYKILDVDPKLPTSTIISRAREIILHMSS